MSIVAKLYTLVGDRWGTWFVIVLTAMLPCPPHFSD